MCGFSIIINLDGQNKRSNIHSIIDMNNLLKHRGPDDEGYLIIDNEFSYELFKGNESKEKKTTQYFHNQHIESKRDSNFKIAMGHRRLSILDLSECGHQPMIFMNRYAIAYNGEIYNYLEIKKELINAGYNFKSTTDTEVILAAYDFWGKECVKKFNGMWAFCIVDMQKRKCFISRDRFGIKPLVYSFSNNQLIIASEEKAIVRSGVINARPNLNNINKFISFGNDESLKETSYENVFRFKKGSFIEQSISQISPSTFQENSFWSLPEKSSNILSINETIDKYLNLLEDAVKIRLRSDVKVSSAFSGGHDSSSIVYFVNKILKNEKYQTYSLIYKSEKYKYCDESKFIDLMSKNLGLKSIQFEPSINNVKDSYVDMVDCMDNPQEYVLLNYLFTYKLISDNNVKVSIDGQGADETLSGYQHYISNYFANEPFFKALSQIKSFSDINESRKFIYIGLISNIINKFGLSKLAQYPINKISYKKNPFINVNERMKLDLNNNLVTLLHYGDRSSMKYSVETRFPFLDYRLVEFLNSCPSDLKINKGWTKYLARLSFKNKLPDEVNWRRDKKGWESPIDIWMKEYLINWGKPLVENNYFLKQLNLNKTIDTKRGHKAFIKKLNLALWYNINFKDG